MDVESAHEPLAERIRDVAEQDTEADEPGLELRDRPKPSRAQRERGGSDADGAATDQTQPRPRD